MEEGLNQPEKSRALWKPMQAYVLAGVCLIVGLPVGYLLRGSSPETTATAATEAAMTQPAAPASTNGAVPSGMPHGVPTMEDMKRMADKKAEPLLARLKIEPNNSDLLNQIGTLYKAAHQFQDATGYYQKAIDADPKNVAARTDLASCLYYEGDADGAIKQLQQSLTYDPRDANTLFNLGMIRLQAKNDPNGAVTAWQQLLKLNPKLAEEKKTAVRKLIARAQKR